MKINYTSVSFYTETTVLNALYLLLEYTFLFSNATNVAVFAIVCLRKQF
jgi:hypothetical protein